MPPRSRLPLLLIPLLALACNLPFLNPRPYALPVSQTLPPAFLPTASPPAVNPVPSQPPILPTLALSGDLLPDSEIVYGPAALDFDPLAAMQDGWLAQAEQYLPSTGRTPAPQVLLRVALENSINPRLLMALLEERCGCVFATPTHKLDQTYLLGVRDERYKGLYRQLTWISERLNEAFYAALFGSPPLEQPNRGWNPGSAALWHYFRELAIAQGESEAQARRNLQAFLSAYRQRFGAPQARALPLLPSDLTQPSLRLPFPSPAQHPWALTGGPHPPWTRFGPWAALDFAPTLRGEGDCAISPDWALAPAAGRVARSEHGALVLDLDFDGDERTGWALLFMHLAQKDRPPVGTDIKTGARLGHPSCEGGPASGAHIHLARKYNGLWIPADGVLPFTLGGWVAHFGEKPYQGSLTNGTYTVTASPYGAHQSVLP